MSQEKNEQLKEDLENSGILDSDWDWSLGGTKSSRMTDFSNTIAENYLKELDPDIQYKELGFLGARLSFIPQSQGCQAFYMYNGDFIMVHAKYSFDQESLMLLLAHESTHHAQNVLVQSNAQDLSQEALWRRSLFATSQTEHNSTVFGIETKSRTYVMPTEWEGTDVYDLSKAMYVLLPNERDARQSEIRIAEMFNITTGRGAADKNAASDLRKAVDTFKERYNCHHLSDEEIYKLVDNATINVTTGRIPSNPIEASITYDMAVFIDGQESWTTKKALEMFNAETKSKILSEAGFENTCTMVLDTTNPPTLQQIQSMSAYSLEQNPHIVAYGLAQYGEQALANHPQTLSKLIDNRVGNSSFDQWYFSEQNNMSRSKMHKLSEILGETYSYDNREKIMDGKVHVRFIDDDKNIDIDQLFSEQNNDLIFDNAASYVNDFTWDDGIKFIGHPSKPGETHNAAVIRDDYCFLER